jgi:hypothetical protein
VRRRWGRLAALAAGALAVILLVAIAANSTPGQSAHLLTNQPSGWGWVDAHGNRVDGTKAKDLGNGWEVRPSAHYLGSNDAPNSEVVHRLALLGMTDVANLRAWHLCAAELDYVADIYKGYTEATLRYPHNAPLNERGTPADLAKRTARWYEEIGYYRDAASLAALNSLPCIEGPLTADAHGVVLSLSVNGQKRQVWVPEYDLLTPLEYYLWADECVVDVEADYATIAARPVATKVEPGRSYLVFSERKKAQELVDLAALLYLLRTTNSGRTC